MNAFVPHPVLNARGIFSTPIHFLSHNIVVQITRSERKVNVTHRLYVEDLDELVIGGCGDLSAVLGPGEVGQPLGVSCERVDELTIAGFPDLNGFVCGYRNKGEKKRNRITFKFV